MSKFFNPMFSYEIKMISLKLLCFIRVIYCISYIFFFSYANIRHVWIIPKFTTPNFRQTIDSTEKWATRRHCLWRGAEANTSMANGLYPKGWRGIGGPKPANSKWGTAAPKGSFWWRDVLKLLDKYKSMASVIISDEKSCLLWEDLWNGQVRKFQFPELHSFAKNKSK